jgi:hypothetical protein
MSLDELVLHLQHVVDRLVRRVRLGPPPQPGRRRLLIVQFDGVSRSVLEQALAKERTPFLRRLLQRHDYRMQPMSAGLPTSTPAFQMAMMYGVQPDIPGFHYHDKRRRKDIHFPRAGHAASVEDEQARGRPGIVTHGSTYGCIFTGGALNNLFTFTMLKRPTGAGVLRALSAFVVLAWVIVKSVVLTAAELVRALLRFIADPAGERARGWRWFAIRIGVSVWVRELFTLAVSRDLYAGVPVIYVNYFDYDLFAHAYGPRHRRAFRALHRLDRSLEQLWRVLRTVPEHRYDLYLLSDHGQVDSIPYQRLSGGKPFERLFFEQFFPSLAPRQARPAHPQRRGLASGIKAIRHDLEPGVFQRFVNYLEQGFPWVLSELPEAHEDHGVRVVSGGPYAFVYFLDFEHPLTLMQIDQQLPGLADEISRSRGIGYVLTRTDDGPVCLWRGKAYRLSDDEPGPFAEREDRALVLQGIRDLMAMPCAGDLVIHGNDSADGNVSYIPETGAHGGSSLDEIQVFIVHPPGVNLPSPITHPTQLYPHFLAYQEP